MYTTLQLEKKRTRPQCLPLQPRISPLVLQHSLIYTELSGLKKLLCSKAVEHYGVDFYSKMIYGRKLAVNAKLTKLKESQTQWLDAVSFYSRTIEATGTVDIYFPCCDQVTVAIVAELKRAKRSIFVQSSYLTQDDILVALFDACYKGIMVEAIFNDTSVQMNAKYAQMLDSQGVKVFIDNDHVMTSNNAIIIDKSFLLTGSYHLNIAKDQKDPGNLMVIRNNPKLIDEYLKNYYEHKSHSRELSAFCWIETDREQSRRPHP